MLELEQISPKFEPAKRGEILAWASYDVANSTYAAVVATAVYNAYFVDVIAGHVPGAPKGFATMMLTVVISISALLVVLVAPIIGTICDATATKKTWLFYSTFVCIVGTATLAAVAPGQWVQGMIVMTVSNTSFFVGENLIAAFLPEIAHQNDMGRISALGWAAGYVGSLLSLGMCFAFMLWAKKMGQLPTQYVPTTMLFCSAYFAMAVAPTFLWLKERALPDPHAKGHNFIAVGFERLKRTITHARHYRDLFAFLVTLFVYSCGTTTVIHMAAVYAQQVFGFTPKDLVTMVLLINITAACGASLFGFVQDKMGSIKTLTLALGIWTLAILVAASSQNQVQFWIAGNLVGIAMGASGSVGRALVAQFSPPGRSGEFLGLWGMAVKLATCVGALSFGGVTFLTHNNFRLGILVIAVFIIAGMFLLRNVNEERGREAALSDVAT